MDVQKYEIIASFVLWIGAVFYGICGVIKAGKVFENFNDVYDDFKEGWLGATIKKDAADYEWETSLTILLQIYPWIIVHIIISECLRQTYFKVVPYWQIIIAVSFITYNIGLTGAAIIASQPIIFECFHKLKRKFFIWICAGICLACIYYIKLLNITEGQVQALGVNETQHYMLVVATCWINLRCISYYIDHASSTQHSIVRVLGYCFYLPTLFLGPFIGYSNFEESQKYRGMTLLSVRINQLLSSIVRFGFWLIFTEFALHYVFINVLTYQHTIVKSLDNWSLYGYGYCMGQFFHLKYVVLYGLSTSLSKFEHIASPGIPKCIGRIHLYSDMWKYFDEGLYKFLVRYIYLPTLGGNAIRHRIFSSFLCFAFIFIWHGIYRHVLVWTMLNFVGICLENLFKHLFKNIESKLKLLNWRWKPRLLCIITSPLLAMSALSNFYFFAGMEIGNIFVDRFIHSSPVANLILLFFLCCCGRVSMEVKRREKCILKK